MRKLLLALGLALGLEGLVSSPVSSPALAQQHQPKSSASSTGRVKILSMKMISFQEDEYVVPDKVFDIFQEIVFPESNFIEGISGGSNRASENDQAEFLRKASTLQLSPEEISRYGTIFFPKEGYRIAIRESVLRSSRLGEVMEHERMHKAIDFLPALEHVRLRRAAQAIVYLTLPLEDALERKEKYGFTESEICNARKKKLTEIYFLRPRMYTSTKKPPIEVRTALEDWNEFYPYLAAGNYFQGVETFLEKQYPEAYQIFSRIREEARVK